LTRKNGGSTWSTTPHGMEHCTGIFGDQAHVHDFVGGNDEGGITIKPDTSLGRYLLGKQLYHHTRKVTVAESELDTHLAPDMKKARRFMASGKKSFDPPAFIKWQHQQEQNLMERLIVTARHTVDDKIETKQCIDKLRREAMRYTMGGMKRNKKDFLRAKKQCVLPSCTCSLHPGCGNGN